MSNVTDPHPPDPRFGWKTCPAPETVRYLGERWKCPDCGRVYYAQDGDDYNDGEGSFRWSIDPLAKQPDLPMPEIA